MKNSRHFANISSLWAAAAVIVLCAMLFLLAPRWPGLEYWQSSASTKAWSGYILMAVLALMWLPAWLRRRFTKSHRQDLSSISQYSVVLNIWHQWLGVLLLLIFMVHANPARSGFLWIQTLLLLVLSGLGIGIAWTQHSWRFKGRRWMMVTHIALAFVVSGFALLHLYFVYAYTR